MNRREFIERLGVAIEGLALTSLLPKVSSSTSFPKLNKEITKDDIIRAQELIKEHGWDV